MGPGRFCRGQNRRWPERRCARPSWRSGVFVSAACSGGRSDCSATSPSARFMGCSRAGPDSASGVGCSTGCAATGGAPAEILRNQAPWSSTVDPVARRRAALTVASTAARRSGASKSMSPSTNTASRWRSMSRRRTGMTRKVSCRFCARSPMVASRARRSAISATAASGWRRPVRRSASPSRRLPAAATDGSFPPASAGWSNGPSPG